MSTDWPQLELQMDTTGYFTGTVHRAMFAKNAVGNEVSAHFVRFDPGARTNWHTHNGEQILIVVSGTVIAQRENHKAVRLEVGQSIRLPAFERHWYGSAGEDAAHIAVNLGGTDWQEAVGRLDYDAAVNGSTLTDFPSSEA